MIGTIWAFIVNTHNVSYLNRIQSPKVKGGMVITADDASYLVPAENLLRIGIWKDNSEGLSAFVQRPPGMGILHLLAYSISPGYSSVVHKCLHIIVHFLGLLLFGRIAWIFFSDKRAIVLQIIYAAIPCYWGYMFYYLTESVTPVILLAILWGFLEFKKNPSSKWLLTQAVFSGLLLLLRPQLIIFLSPVFYSSWLFLKKSGKSNVHIIIMTFTLILGAFLLWQIRGMSIVGYWPGMHPVYNTSNKSPYRPVHQSFGEIYKIWEHNSEHFHTDMLLIWDHPDRDSLAVMNDISLILSGIPDKIKKKVGEEEWENMFYQFHLISADVHNGLYQVESPREKALRQRINRHTTILRSAFWKDNYLITPFHSARFLLTKSQLNLDIFQHLYRGRWWMEVLRYFSVLLLLSWLMGTTWGIIKFRNELYFLFGTSVLMYMGYLFFIQKMNEERYLFPILPIILVLGYNALFKSKSNSI